MIIPETLSVLCSEIGGVNIRKILWWLSVDNYLKSFNLWLSRYVEKECFLQSSLLECGLIFPNYKFLEHWVQSEYAKQFIKKNGIQNEKIYYVGDYLRLDAHKAVESYDANNRCDWVAFNPSKGFEFTKKLIAADRNIEWKPIHGMSPKKVHELLLKSKVYIDFGNHPGQDRLPREAAMAGCCVITGLRGAAANDIDIPILAKYKIKDSDANIPLILQKINYCIYNYDECQNDFTSYRSMICKQREQFSTNLKEALSYTFFYNLQPCCVIVSHIDVLNKHYDYFQKQIQGYKLIGILITGYKGKIIKSENGECPVFELDDCVFLYQEGRINHFFVFTEDDERSLLAMGVPISSITVHSI